MPVKLNLLPHPPTMPKSPRWIVWLLLLFGFILSGFIFMSLTGNVTDDPSFIIVYIFGIPTVLWGILFFIRYLIYAMRCQFIVGWNEAYQKEMIKEIRKGRRSLQILGSVMCSALKNDQNGVSLTEKEQLDLLLKQEIVLRSQNSWFSESPTRHSRIHYIEDESIEELIRRTLFSIIEPLKELLLSVDEQLSISLLCEMESSLSDTVMEAILQEILNSFKIGKDIVIIDNSGMNAIDDWLDNHIHDNAVLVVIALQIAPLKIENSAESAVGLVFANRLTQKSQLPLAYMHRPEQTSNTEIEHGLQQALDWVPIFKEDIAGVWLSELSSENYMAITLAIEYMSLNVDEKVYNLDMMLGYAGCVAPWLTLAMATQVAQETNQYQLILNGLSKTSLNIDMWCVVVSPYSETQERML